MNEAILFFEMLSSSSIGIIFSVCAVFVFSFVVTRNTEDIKLMLFPMSIALNTIGFSQNILFVFFCGALFVLTFVKGSSQAFASYVSNPFKIRG